jgi:ectoine hydroxylase-related dioxygenase (phytanoyl-CoA dioxygenase family)
MLFELFEFVDDTSLGRLLTAFLGERPLLSGIKATLRRIPPDVDVDGRWHQDGSFLGQRVKALNIWLALDHCGTDAPSLDVVPKRLSGVVEDADSRYEWAVSDDAVLRTADATPIVRPRFEPGDALLFDHLLLHRTGASAEMRRERRAIESWFFAPAAYPADQLPIMY